MCVGQTFEQVKRYNKIGTLCKTKAPIRGDGCLEQSGMILSKE